MTLIQKLREAPGRSEKEYILQHYVKTLEKAMFRYAYDKNFTFGLHFSALDIEQMEALFPLQDPYPEDFALLEKLRTREYTGHLAKAEVYKHCRQFGPLVMLICNKDLDCGVTATTINKVIPGLIPQFKVQLAKEQPLEKIKLPCYVETKFDGVRIIITIDTQNKVTFRTRNGHEVHLPESAKILSAVGIYPIMLDTEVTLSTGKMEDRTQVAGMLNSARHGTKINESLLVFNIFDRLELSEFEQQKCTQIFVLRRRLLQETVNVIQNLAFKAVDSFICCSVLEIELHYKTLIAKGFEGLIIKHGSDLYQYKRSTTWTKMKETKTADLKCIEVLAGDGKYKDEIGALLCVGNVEGKRVWVKVGSGLTDSDRAKPWDTYQDKTIEVKYNSVIQNVVTEQYSLFLPRFVCVRFDK